MIATQKSGRFDKSEYFRKERNRERKKRREAKLKKQHAQEDQLKYKKRSDSSPMRECERLLQRKHDMKCSPPSSPNESSKTTKYVIGRIPISEIFGKNSSSKLLASPSTRIDSKWLSCPSKKTSYKHFTSNRYSNAARITQESPRKRLAIKAAASDDSDSDSDSDDSLLAHMGVKDEKEQHDDENSQEQTESPSDEDNKRGSPTKQSSRKRRRESVDSESSSSSEDESDRHSQTSQKSSPQKSIREKIRAAAKRAKQAIVHISDSNKKGDFDLEVTSRTQNCRKKMSNEEDQPSGNPFCESPSFSSQIDRDCQLAKSLQEQELRKNAKQESEQMKSSLTGKAVTLVNDILHMTKSFRKEYSEWKHYIKEVSEDEMVPFAEGLLKMQEEFRKNNIPTYVDVGYHYTNEKNLDSIRANGLKTRNERLSQGIRSDKFNGDVYGDGIYTANNPFSFEGFGDTGLMVGRLLGSVKDFPDTTGNTVFVRDLGIVVLKTSAQCLPIIKYPKVLINSKNGKELIEKCHTLLQRFLDEVFNPGLTPHNFENAPVAAASITSGMHLSLPHALRGGQRNATLQRLIKNCPFPTNPTGTHQQGMTQQHYGNQQVLSRHCNFHNASNRTTRRNNRGWGNRTTRRNNQRIRPRVAIVQPDQLHYAAPESLSCAQSCDAFYDPPMSCNFQDSCSICHDELKNPQDCFALKQCTHVFHKDCIIKACNFASTCPTCKASIGTPIGKSPSGSMTVSINTTLKCGGFPSCNTIEIAYSIHSGIQKHYHESPDQYHSGKFETAFLPSNTEGQDLLKRLKFAFMHGLTFTVGTSMTTGAANQCTWASIHHKTYPNGGVHGFPDPDYFSNCNGELDGLNVPAAHELDGSGKKLKN